jgi:hypothetical protein
MLTGSQTNPSLADPLTLAASNASIISSNSFVFKSSKYSPPTYRRQKKCLEPSYLTKRAQLSPEILGEHASGALDLAPFNATLPGFTPLSLLNLATCPKSSHLKSSTVAIHSPLSESSRPTRPKCRRNKSLTELLSPDEERGSTAFPTLDYEATFPPRGSRLKLNRSMSADAVPVRRMFVYTMHILISTLDALSESVRH